MEIGQRKFNGNCFNCGKQGHPAKFCPEPRRNRPKVNIRQVFDQGDVTLEELKALIKEKEGQPTYNPNTCNPACTPTLYEPKDSTPTAHISEVSSDEKDFQPLLRN